MFPDRKQQVLVVDDEPNLRRVLAAQLSLDGYDVHTAPDGEQGLRMLSENHIDLVITDLKMPGVDGMELLRQALRGDPELPVLMITAHGTVDNAVEALKTGAFDYITKPFDQAEVRSTVRKALDTRRLASQEARTATQNSVVEFGLIGHSPAIMELNQYLVRVADEPGPLTIVGESGTGKEVVARAVHEHCARRDQPFVKVNCAAIPPDLMESELFGHALTTSGKPGRLELAQGGTVFLDEIGCIPLSVQRKLRRAMTERAFERVGGVGKLPLDARLIAASRRSPAELKSGSEFDTQLAALLCGNEVSLPPLRERPQDIKASCADIIARLNARFGKQVTDVSSAAADVLKAHPWPGNIRELENVLEYAVLLCESDVIDVIDLPSDLGAASSNVDAVAAGPEDQGLRAQVKAITSRLERQLIQKALQQTQGNVTHAARLLKISRKGLQLKMKELGLRERDE